MKVDILSLYLSLFWFLFSSFSCVCVCGFVGVMWRGGGLCEGEGGLRSGGVEAGGLGCLLYFYGWEDNAGYSTRLCQAWFGIFFVSGTWQLYASINREGQWTKRMCND